MVHRIQYVLYSTFSEHKPMYFDSWAEARRNLYDTTKEYLKCVDISLTAKRIIICKAYLGLRCKWPGLTTADIKHRIKSERVVY